MTLISDSLLTSYVNEATYGVVIHINKVIRTAREVARVSHPSPTSTIYPIFIAFDDAAWAVRKYGESQGGSSARWRQSAHITSVVLVTQVCLGWPRWSLRCEVRSAHGDVGRIRGRSEFPPPINGQKQRTPSIVALRGLIVGSSFELRPDDDPCCWECCVHLGP